MVEGWSEDGRRIWIGGIWSSYAPGWGVTADLLKKRPKFAKIVEIASK